MVRSGYLYVNISQYSLVAMQVADGPVRSAVTVAPSYALELAWALHAATQPSLRERHPDLADLYDHDADLLAEVRGFWPEDTCFTELQALAHIGGLMTEVAPAGVVDGLAEACERIPDRLAMDSEREADRRVFDRRLHQLRDDRRLRRRYLALVGRVSEHLASPWAAWGLPAARAAADDIGQQLATGRRWTQLVVSCCEIFQAHLPELVAQVDDGAPLQIAPCAFFGSGLYLNFDGSLVVGAGVGREDALSRSRTEELARRLRVLADPTRLAIVDYLLRQPRPVGDVAKAFGLAQPTVSNHLKVLREAGLVVAERQDGRRVHSADSRAFTELVDHLRGLVV